MVERFHCVSELQTSSPGDTIQGEDGNKQRDLMTTVAVFILILLYLDVHRDHPKMHLKMYPLGMIALRFVHRDS